MTGSPLLALLHLSDSLFPLGGFAHSDGLEAATASGLLSRAADLQAWMDASLDESLGRADGPAALLAWRFFSDGQLDALQAIDDEVYALRPASSGRQASRSMGARLLKTWQQLHPESALKRLEELPSGQMTLPVSFGVVCASVPIEERAMLEAFFYTRLAAIVSSAMRLMPIGQHEAHALLARALARAPLVIDGVLARAAPPASFMPGLDLAAMSQQYVHSRLFRS